MAAKPERAQRALWTTWLVSLLGLAGVFSYALFGEGDKTLFMPGPLSSGHHQLGVACATCHTEALGGGEVIEQACVDCHGDERKKPHDTHPASMFQDPRNADLLAAIDATRCMTCHTEHRPEITLKNGLTQPRDLCFHCHAAIAEERLSHEGMAFANCTDSGCHNYHNNRALYTEFLSKRLDQPDVDARPVLPRRELLEALANILEYPHDTYPITALDLDNIDAVPVAASPHADWLASAHAGAGVNCSACHVVALASDEAPTWHDQPGDAGCQQCHQVETERFGQGKHGMRLAAGLSPMTPAMARLPMVPAASHAELTCNSCHGAHRYDTAKAATEACVGCHNDTHTLAYDASPHAALWRRELAGDLPEGQGVSCASCHMPRVSFDVSDWVSRIVVDHNQSANLSPNSKMLRSACLHCHGLPFSLNALADEALIDRNFHGQPTIVVDSMDMARRDDERARKETSSLRD